MSCYLGTTNITASYALVFLALFLAHIWCCGVRSPLRFSSPISDSILWLAVLAIKHNLLYKCHKPFTRLFCYIVCFMHKFFILFINLAVKQYTYIEGMQYYFLIATLFPLLFYYSIQLEYL